jgi:hypothetical protein
VWPSVRMAVFERICRGLTSLRNVAGGTPAFQSVDGTPAFQSVGETMRCNVTRETAVLQSILHTQKIYPRCLLRDVQARDNL